MRKGDRGGKIGNGMEDVNVKVINPKGGALATTNKMYWRRELGPQNNARKGQT